MSESDDVRWGVKAARRAFDRPAIALPAAPVSTAHDVAGRSTLHRHMQLDVGQVLAEYEAHE